MNVTRIRADLHIGSGFPDEEGKRLAEHVISVGHNFHKDKLEIDLRRVKSRLLISSFFSSFFDHLYETDASRAKALTEIEWLTDHEFQLENIQRVAAAYDPDVCCIARGIRKLSRADHLSIGVPPAHKTPALFVAYGGDTYQLPLSNELAEVLIAEGITYQG